MSDKWPQRVRLRPSVLYSLLCFGISLLVFGGVGCAKQPLRFDRWGWEPIQDPVETVLWRKSQILEERLFQQHLSTEGVLHYRRPVDPHPETGPWLPLADQSCWTGYLLAGLCLQHAVEPSELNLARIRQVVGGLELLHDATGVPGFIARCVVPASMPTLRRHKPHVWQVAAHDDQYFCRIDTSKDQYSGYVYGLVSVVTLVSDPGLVERCQLLLRQIARHLHEGDLLLVGVDGEQTPFGNLRGRIWGLPIGVNAGISSVIFRAVANDFKDPQLAKAARGRLAQLANDFEPLHFEFLGIRNYSNDLMGAVALAALELLETSPSERRRLRGVTRRFLEAFPGEGNAFFHTVGVLYGVSEPSERDFVVRNLCYAPDDLRLFGIPEELWSDLPRLLLPDRKFRRRSAEAIPLRARPVSTFSWRTNPRALNRKAGQDGTLQISGVDLFWAYWAGRYSGWIDAPQSQ